MTPKGTPPGPADFFWDIPPRKGPIPLFGCPVRGGPYRDFSIFRCFVWGHHTFRVGPGSMTPKTTRPGPENLCPDSFPEKGPIPIFGYPGRGGTHRDFLEFRVRVNDPQSDPGGP
jgi:hypothetical protein